MAAKVSIGQTSAQPSGTQVTVGQPTIDKTVNVGVGTPQMGGPSAAPPAAPPSQGVGAPSQGANSPMQNGVVPFSLFYQVIKGDRALAEQLVPGLTTPQGVKLLGASDQGKPTVQFKTVNAMAQFQQLLQQHQAQKTHGANAGPGQPEYVPFDQVQHKMGHDGLNHAYGIEDGPANYLGFKQYVKHDPVSGKLMIRNPDHPATKAMVQKESAHRAAMTDDAKKKVAAEPTPRNATAEDDR